MRASFRMALLLLAVVAALLCFSTASAEIYFHEKFDTLDGWVQSKHKSDYGKVANAAGKVFVNEASEKGLQLTEDAHFYALSKKLPTPVDNENKDLVVSFSVKNEQVVHCAGTYIKLLPDMDPETFNGDTPYWLMFGPDRCSTTRTHIIFHYKGKNLEWKLSSPPPVDKLTHVYTLHIRANSTYELYVDGTSTSRGPMERDWAFLEPKMIPDPADKKPEDWVDAASIPDPEDTKPEGWDDAPATIVDPDATKPEDWDDAEDGAWEPPMVPNPAYRGAWHARTISNPAYKGPWVAQQIPNPDYVPDTQIYHVMAPLQYVGVDVWQVESGSVYDNIIIGDNFDEVMALVKETYGAMAAQEKILRAKLDEAASMEGSEESEHGHAHGHDHGHEHGDDEDGDL